MNIVHKERGQAIVLIVLAILGMVAFAALAIDGGMMYAERRRAQNAADAAVMSAARAASMKMNATDTGKLIQNVLVANGFSATAYTYHHPPVDGPYAGKDEYYQVKINVKSTPIFSQFLFSNAIETTVNAVARFSPPDSITGKNAIVTLETTTGQNGITLNGGLKLYICGGNMWSNNNGNKTGNSQGGGQGPEPGVYVRSEIDANHALCADSTKPNNGKISTVGTWGNKDEMYATFVDHQTPMKIPNIAEPYCPTDSDNGATRLTATYQFGTAPAVNYYVETSSTMPSTLEPGIHCIYGNLTKNVTGSDVLLVLKNGSVSYTGNGKLFIDAADKMVDKNGNDWGKMLIYAPKTNTGDFNFGGNSQSLFTGTIFAPGMNCDFGGTPDNNSNHVAMFCNSFRMHGNPYIDITYIPSEQFQVDAFAELSQ